MIPGEGKEGRGLIFVSGQKQTWLLGVDGRNRDWTHRRKPFKTFKVREINNFAFKCDIY